MTAKSANRLITDRAAKRKAPRTAWVKGVSGNPNGRPPKGSDAIALEAACRDRAPAALAVLDQLMRTADRDSVRLSAALSVLERAYGRPVGRQEFGGPGTFEQASRSIEDLRRGVMEKAAKLGFRMTYIGSSTDDK
jgi:hypothetical protein